MNEPAASAGPAAGPARTAPRRLARPGEALLVALIFAIGLVARAPGIGESLLGDELYTYDIATSATLGGVFDEINETELNPPLYFVLAWLCAKLGDPVVAIRIPSLAFGTAAVPMVWLVGRRAVGREAALLGAALFALAPFAVYYASEARAYSTLVFLALLSTYALLRALDDGGRGWWVAYAAVTAAVMYTHYTGVFVLTVQAAWALWAHRERWRALAIASSAAAVAYLPWVPFIRENVPVDIIEVVFPLTARNFVRGLLRLFPGHPNPGLAEVPGRAGVVLVALGLAVAVALLAVWIARAWRSRAGSLAPPDPRLVLIVALAAAAPIGAVVADFAGHPIYFPRNLISSLPALCLALAALAAGGARVSRPGAAAAAALLVAGAAVGTVQTLRPQNGRAQYKAAAEWVDERARPGDPVAQVPGFQARGVLRQAFSIHFDRPHALFTVEDDPRAALSAARREGRLYVITLRAADAPPTPEPGPPLRLVDREWFPGSTPVEALEYAAPGEER